MSRGPRPRKALSEAVQIARERETVQVAGENRENLYDFAIVSVIPVTFVRVKYAARIFAPFIDFTAGFRDDILRLSSICGSTGISRELWLRSKHGTWRFFRIISSDDLIELDRRGQPSAGPKNTG